MRKSPTPSLSPPNLISPPEQPGASPQPAKQAAASEQRWLWAGYLFIAFFFVTRLAYLAAGRIELSEDEAYQWLWSKHLALSYYSKPPLIAYLQFLGTHMWGDNEFGVRFLSPVLGALLSLLMLRFLAAEVSARAGFWLVVILAATPILAVGCTLLTVDAPSVFFWVAAFVCGWRAIQSGGPGYWCGLGICLGLGFLSKYTAVAQIPSFILFFLLYPPARRHLRRPGPYLALALASLAFLPVLWWNYRHGWITLTHLYERGGLDHAWRFQWRMPVEFLGAELGLLNPIFCVAMIGSAMFCWRNARRGPLVLYLFTMGAPLFLFYTLYTLRARVQPNWIAPAVVPLFALMVIDGEQRWEAGEKNVGRLLTAGLVVGFLLVGFLHATEITQWVTGRPLPIALDPMRRVRGWGDIARMMEAERVKLSQEGKPVFFIVHDYWTAAVLTFYLPEAKRGVPDQPIVYCPASDHPENQFYFWPSYTGRKGQDALYIRETDDPMPIPGTVSAGFRSVTDLGMRDALYHGQVFRRFQLFKCQELR